MYFGTVAWRFSPPDFGKINTKFRNISALAFVVTAFICAALALPSLLAANLFHFITSCPWV